MEYYKIIAVTGLSGLFELLSSKNDGAIVRSLEDGSTKFVSSRIHNFSHLEGIEIYTEQDNVNLVEVFNAMAAGKEALPSEKDNAAVKAYFQKVFPQMDFERVYASDMKKMVKWFSILQKNNIEIKVREEEEEVIADEPVAEEVKEAKPKKAKAAKEAEESAEEVKPKKAKAAAKKEEDGEEKPKAKKAKAAKKKED